VCSARQEKDLERTEDLWEEIKQMKEQKAQKQKLTKYFSYNNIEKSLYENILLSSLLSFFEHHPYVL
jgi:hypothetical protein